MRWFDSELSAIKVSISPVGQDTCIQVVKVLCAVVEGRSKSEEDEVLFWNETKAKLRAATETHLRLMIKQRPSAQKDRNS
jgi:hypothetical protein